MSLGLNNIDIAPSATSSLPSNAERTRMARTVRTMGIIALAMTIGGLFIPVLGFIMLIVAYFLSKRVLRQARDYLVPDEDERYARWASTISIVTLVFSGISTLIFVLSL